MDSYVPILLGLIAAAIPAWWAGLIVDPRFRALFVPAGEWPAFQVLLLPDAALAVFAGVAAVRVRRGQPARSIVAALAGGWAYATLFSVAWTLRAGAPPLGAALMMAGLAALAVCWYALLSPSPPRAS